MNARVGKKKLAANQPLTDTPALTIQDVRRLIEEIWTQRNTTPRREIIGFDEIVSRLPLSARSLRTEIKNGRIPAIRLPGARRLLFDWEAVRLALNRFSRGGIE